VRLILRNRLFTLAAVLTLGVGIAANSAVFSLLNVILFHPLPYPGAGRIVALRQKNPSRGLTQQLVSVPDYFDWKRGNQVFESIAAWNFQYFNLTGADQAERIEGLQVTAGFFPVLGVTAALGRTFLPEEEQPGRSRVVLLSDSLWRQRFAADQSVPGRTIMVEGQPYTIGGVLTRDFRLFRVLNRDLDLLRPPRARPHRAAGNAGGDGWSGDGPGGSAGRRQSAEEPAGGSGRHGRGHPERRCGLLPHVGAGRGVCARPPCRARTSGLVPAS